MSQTINPDETSTWRHKIAEFKRAPKDGRSRVLFIDQISTVQTLIRDGASFDGLKVLIYDSLDMLRRIDGIKIIDCDVVQLDGCTPTEVLFRLLPDVLNNTIDEEPTGIVDGLLAVDLTTPLPELAAVAAGSAKKSKSRGRKSRPKSITPSHEPALEDTVNEPVLPIAEVLDDPEALDEDEDEDDDEAGTLPEPRPKVETKPSDDPKPNATGKKKAKKKHPTVTNKRLFG